MISETRIAAQLSRCQRAYDSMMPEEFDDRFWHLDEETMLDDEKKTIIVRSADEDGWCFDERPIEIGDFDIYPELKEIVPDVLEELLSGDDGSSEGD